jgi:hypothetical protein
VRAESPIWSGDVQKAVSWAASKGMVFDDWWLESRVANREVAITSFDFVIEKKTNPCHHKIFSETFWKINIPVLTIIRCQNFISWTSNICSTKITTGVFTQESPSTLHVSYRTVKHWICPFNPNFIYEFLGQTLYPFCSKFTTERLNEFYHCRLESSPFCERGRRDRASTPFKEWWGTALWPPLLVYAQQLDAIEVSVAGASR